MIIVVDATSGDTLPGFASQTLLAVAMATSTPRLAYQRADGAWLPTGDDAGELRAEGYRVEYVTVKEAPQ